MPEIETKETAFARDIASKYKGLGGGAKASMTHLSSDTPSLGSRNLDFSSSDLEVINQAIKSLAAREGSREGWASWISGLSKQLSETNSTSENTGRFFVDNGAAIAISLGLHNIQGNQAQIERAGELLSRFDQHGLVNKDNYLSDFLTLRTKASFKHNRSLGVNEI